ncbi:hypothetical protein CTI12_AA631690 [Artemisia annua]|uniref:GBF-interacting protein 1 N-terminal domain-containing protein n=1 Tax=Artemisia annua TaxID=35608 RepID=A0A2U1K8L4_ARTAN|nr:hypothetical protein CTI12_AA631690 [Artemisia annua]
MSGGGRGVKKTIQNIKEITGNNYSEDEIYAMLKECNMDPNETTQNLLAQVRVKVRVVFGAEMVFFGGGLMSGIGYCAQSEGHC